MSSWISKLHKQNIVQHKILSRVDNWGELANRFLLIVCKYSSIKIHVGRVGSRGEASWQWGELSGIPVRLCYLPQFGKSFDLYTDVHSFIYFVYTYDCQRSNKYCSRLTNLCSRNWVTFYCSFTIYCHPILLSISCDVSSLMRR